MELIPPDVRSRLKSLRLTARRAVGQSGIGLHQSHTRGAGLEFAQYRAYEPGDELRQIDWKLYARSDKFFVREAERESPVAVWILLDASASMAARFDAARGLAAAIAELALRQGDRFGLVMLREQGLGLTPPGSGARHRDRMLLDLHAARTGGAFPNAERLGSIWERIGARDMVILLSDCFDESAVAMAERLAAAQREVLAIQVLTVDERDFDFRGGYRFRDPETGEELLGDGTAMREDFLRRFGEAKAALHARLDASGIRHAEYVTDQPLDAPLRALFA